MAAFEDNNAIMANHENVYIEFKFTSSKPLQPPLYENVNNDQDNVNNEQLEGKIGNVDTQQIETTTLPESFVKQQTCKAVYKISGYNTTGTAFLCNIKVNENVTLHGIMTCHHVLKVETNENHEITKTLIHYTFTIEIKPNNIVHEIELITMNENRTYESNYQFVVSDKNLDLTFIALTKEYYTTLLNEQCTFLDLADDFNNINETFHILQYPDGGSLCYAEGKITGEVRLESAAVIHLISTDCGSSGAPVLNNHGQVRALHRAFLEKPNGKECNLAREIKPIKAAICDFYDKRFDEIKYQKMVKMVNKLIKKFEEIYNDMKQTGVECNKANNDSTS